MLYDTENGVSHRFLMLTRDRMVCKVGTVDLRICIVVSTVIQLLEVEQCTGAVREEVVSVASVAPVAVVPSGAHVRNHLDILKQIYRFVEAYSVSRHTHDKTVFIDSILESDLEEDGRFCHRLVFGQLMVVVKLLVGVSRCVVLDIRFDLPHL